MSHSMTRTEMSILITSMVNTLIHLILEVADKKMATSLMLPLEELTEQEDADIRSLLLKTNSVGCGLM